MLECVTPLKKWNVLWFSYAIITDAIASIHSTGTLHYMEYVKVIHEVNHSFIKGWSMPTGYESLEPLIDEYF